MDANGMVRPCSCPASDRIWQRGAKDKERAMPETVQKAIVVVGIDIGKNSFHVVGQDERGAIVLHQKWSRGQPNEGARSSTDRASRFEQFEHCRVRQISH
jgi:hypothetical protein